MPAPTERGGDRETGYLADRQPVMRMAAAMG